jgi:hypothetical protein
MWYNAKVNDPSIGIPKGTKVLVKKSNEDHRSIGPTWWVYDGLVLRQVAESFGGVGLHQVVRLGNVFSEQTKVEKRFAKLYTVYLRTKLSKPVQKPAKTAL